MGLNAVDPVAAGDDDIDGDGTNDVINSVAHGYGIHWWRGLGPDADGKLQFEEHLIDDSWSQPHFQLLVDLDNDGQDELIAAVILKEGSIVGTEKKSAVIAYDLNR